MCSDPFWVARVHVIPLPHRSRPSSIRLAEATGQRLHTLLSLLLTASQTVISSARAQLRPVAGARVSATG